MATVMFAPDSFKGSLNSIAVAEAMAEGWLSVRPKDSVILRPMADGGEGTLECVHRAHPHATRHSSLVTGPAGVAVMADWLMLPNTTAVLELAESSGLPLMDRLDPLGATTRGLGELIAIALERGAEKIVIALGGSATNDAGIGALEALGLRVTRQGDESVGALGIQSLDSATLPKAPPGGIQLLVDTSVSMLDAPRIFGPQKGATASDVEKLTAAFHSLTDLVGDASAHQAGGSGAAGGTAWGLATFLGAQIVPGAAFMAELTGVSALLPEVDFVVTGEGKFDQTSLTGKVVGHLISELRGQEHPGALIVGTSDGSSVEGWPMVRLVDIVDSESAALSGAEDAIAEAARLLAMEAGSEIANTGH